MSSGVPAGATVAFGARVWADAPSTVSLHVFQLDAGGGNLGSTQVDSPVSPAATRLSGTFTMLPGAATFRIELYLGTTGTIHHLDDAWVTPRQ
jgi:hypothetical protein